MADIIIPHYGSKSMFKDVYRLCYLTAIILVITLCYPFAKPFHKWKRISSNRFTVMYNDNTYHLAEKTCAIAEDIAEKMADYFNYTFKPKKKIFIVLIDDEDISNGSASVYYPLVRIFCRKTPFLWRGESDWLRTALSHELSHIFSIQRIKKPILLGGQITIHSEPNNLDNTIETYMDHRMLPLWFIEAASQIGSLQYKVDFRDPYREMLLRDALIHNKLLTLKEMSRFEGTSREYELVYNQGFSFLLYILNKYENVTMKKLCKEVARIGINRAIRSQYSKEIEQLYDEWKYHLEQKYPVKPNTTSSIVYNRAMAPMCIETKSAMNGQAVIANWKYDYSRFDLFILDGSGKKIEKRIKDVYSNLAHDPYSNTLYFSKNTYYHSNGASTYDLFALSADSKMKQVTKKKRVLAFDAKENYLIYAIYRYGYTTIVERQTGSKPENILTFGYDTAVYDISIQDKKTIYLTCGIASTIKPAILSEKKCTFLWPEVKADITDFISYKKDLAVFCSTIDGSPQIYLCYVQQTPNVWYKVTNCSGGARFPTISITTTHDTIIHYSKFSNGSFKIHKLEEPLCIIDTIIIADSGVTSFHSYERKDIPQISTTTSQGAILPFIPQFNAGLSFNTFENNTSLSKYNFIYLSAAGALKDPEETFSWFNYFELNMPTSLLGKKFVYPEYLSQFEAQFGFVDLTLKYFVKRQFSTYQEQNSTSDIDYILRINNTHRTISADLEYQTSQKSNLSLRQYVQWYSLSGNIFIEGEPGTVKIDLKNVYISSVTGINWEYFDYTPVFDPGRLGNTYYGLILSVDMFNNKYKKENIDTTKGFMEPNPTFLTQGFIEYKTVLWNHKISLYSSIDAFTYGDVVKDSLLSFLLYNYIGNESHFSGYRPRYIKITRAVRATFEILCNPFLNILDKTKWFERAHIGIKCEGGVVSYFTDKLRTGFPISLEYIFRYNFYLRPNIESSFYIKYGMPLNDLNTDRSINPGRFYIGINL